MSAHYTVYNVGEGAYVFTIPHPAATDLAVTFARGTDEVGNLFTVSTTGWAGYGTPVYTRSLTSALATVKLLITRLWNTVQPEY